MINKGKACSSSGCEGQAYKLGMCNKHYQRYRAAIKPRQACACGCGELTPAKYVQGHATKLLSAEEQSRRGRQNDGSKQRDRGSADWYRKFRGRHEHRFVMECLLGRELGPNEIVHHINGNKKDNRPCNLQLMSRSEHINEHRREMQEAARAKRSQSASA